MAVMAVYIQKQPLLLLIEATIMEELTIRQNSKTTFVTINHALKKIFHLLKKNSKTTFVTINHEIINTMPKIVQFKNNLCYY